MMIGLAFIVWCALCAVDAATNIGISQRPVVASGGGCALNVRKDFPGKNPPVILVDDGKGDYKLAEPTSHDRYFSFINLNGKKFLLACPGEGNGLNIGGVEVEATCSSSGEANQFVINGRHYKTDAVACTKRVTPFEYNTRQSCSGDGTLLKLGYLVSNKIYDAITVCHRISDGATYYSRHILDGNHFPERGNGGRRTDEDGRPQFSFFNKDLFRGFPPYRFYNDNAQIAALSYSIGSAAAREIYNKNKERFFAKGHLTPNADFIFETSRDITFLYVNTQPQWQEINGGNWNRTEVATRWHAAATGKKYEVITGSAGILAPTNKAVQLDYTHGRIPVPHSYTKLIREIESNKCIAFVSTNFPEDTTPKKLCTDICAANSWPDFKDAKSAGYVYCCSYNEFVKAFPKAAPAVNCSGGVLRYKSK